MDKQHIRINDRTCTVYRTEDPKYLLIQPVGGHERETLDDEVMRIRQASSKGFVFAAFEVNDWNSVLSPWEAPPVFGDTPFGSGAEKTLAFLENKLIPQLTAESPTDRKMPVVLGGYSLAGLFALWCGYTSGRFAAVAGVSPSVWFNGWKDYCSVKLPYAECIYLSLGKKEEKTRNTTMSAVGDNIRFMHEKLSAAGKNTLLEWNEGNHFTEPEIRTAKGLAWCLDNI